MLGRDALAPDTIVPAAMPIPICLGVFPDGLWLEAFQTDQDIRAYWRGYALAGTVCAVLLIIELVTIHLLL
ncbi:hypothetical protein X769_33065 [Mesorhizobium sp. LSJC268A00]|uniref:hypothetical protein n=1 Tax=unclassified Mesorhizobium TaxID=325217 RepID=UPI0003CE1FBB|nr:MULTISPECIES: hypothetical protein [unclassified Mesorhizobium]ESW94374.1 hypothetical protein X769_33065 [Mesorhizobium sp. LSJC268A00]ESX08777.1 hypothetical protein X766_34020 [Mesorhizobium sp. LSJC255A00]WJI52089.1 hypothetical protein NLY44_05160 [Mesorhizobium sp. C089B]